jgi:branched-chain amino acid transport system ATP-binding protein
MRWISAPLLAIEGLTMRFGGLIAVDNLDFAVGRGDITALIGPNGAGKTTVFNCVTGFYRCCGGRMALARTGCAAKDDVRALTHTGRRSASMASGEIFLLERMADFEIAKYAGVARTFQNIRLFQGMTLIENLIVAQHNRLIGAGLSFSGLTGFGGYRAREKAALDSARYWLDRIGLLDRADDPAGALPYGAQRRVEIARAMCAEPVLLCLDEPAAGLNPHESHELNALLLSLRDEHETSILLIEHDMSVVMEISDHVVVLDYGVKIADGRADEIRHDPDVIKAYLGVDDAAETGAPKGDRISA